MLSPLTVYLIVKGFKPAPILAQATRKTEGQTGPSIPEPAHP